MIPTRVTGAALGAALLLTAAPTEAQSNRTRPVEFVAGGVQVIHKPVTANDVVAVRLYLKGGSAAHTPATAGTEGVMGQMLTRGTERYSRQEFAARATATGTRIGSETTYDFTAITAQAVRQNWEEAWDLFTQAVLHPTFPAEELTQVKSQTLNMLRQRRDNPDQLLNLLGDSVAYAGTALAVDPVGTVASVEALTRDDLQRRYRERMTRANLLLVVVGNIPRADLERKVAAAFASLPAQGGAPPATVTPAAARAEVTVVSQALPTNYIGGMFRTPSLSSDDYAAARLALFILHNRLFEEVRTKRNLSYAVAAQIFSRSINLGRLYVTAVSPDTTLRVMLEQVTRLQREPVSTEEVQENRNVLITSYWTGQLTNMGQASQLGLWELLGGGWENQEAFVDRLQRVTPADVQRVAQRYLRDARFVVIGDPARIDRALFGSL